MNQSMGKFSSLLTLKNYLLIANAFLVFILILLSNSGALPLQAGDFIFFSILTLIFALYRPGWAFLFFIGTLPLENINLAPVALGFNIRAYQLIGACAVTAIIIRILTKRLNFSLRKPTLPDYLIIIMAVAGFVSAKVSVDTGSSLKLALIFATFVLLYFLIRNFIRNMDDLKKVIPFFLSSSVIIITYGIWQNISFLGGSAHFEAMPGRPNATFSEADWLGMYLVLVVSACYSILYFFQANSSNLKTQVTEKFSVTDNKKTNRLKILILILFLCLQYILLIITVSRSAWLGVFAATFIFLFSIFTNLKFHFYNWRWMETIRLKMLIIVALIFSVFAVYAFHLTNFSLLNRASSTGSGMQKITVSCENPVRLVKTDDIPVPQQISDVSELAAYGCRHINLEDIAAEKEAGRIIATVSRPDPNVQIRTGIYEKSWSKIQNNFVLGIGWGSIGQALGKDGQGHYFNSSNILLEAWLGMGFTGLVALVGLLIFILGRALKIFSQPRSFLEKNWSLFIISSWLGIITANLFNAGIFLGFFWLWLAISNIEMENK